RSRNGRNSIVRGAAKPRLKPSQPAVSGLPISISRLAHRLLIETIITMILISLQPFQAKKLLLLVAAILGLCSAACFAQSNYMTVSSTPYDHQMTRIHSVLTSKSASHKDLSVGLVNQWI